MGPQRIVNKKNNDKIGVQRKYKRKKSQNPSKASQLGLSEEERLQVGPAGVSEAACHSSFLHPIPSRHVVIIRIAIVIIENYRRCVCNQLKTSMQVLLVQF